MRIFLKPYKQMSIEDYDELFETVEQVWDWLQRDLLAHGRMALEYMYEKGEYRWNGLPAVFEALTLIDDTLFVILMVI